MSCMCFGDVVPEVNAAGTCVSKCISVMDNHEHNANGMQEFFVTVKSIVPEATVAALTATFFGELEGGELDVGGLEEAAKVRIQSALDKVFDRLQDEECTGNAEVRWNWTEDEALEAILGVQVARPNNFLNLGKGSTSGFNLSATEETMLDKMLSDVDSSHAPTRDRGRKLVSNFLYGGSRKIRGASFGLLHDSSSKQVWKFASETGSCVPWHHVAGCGLLHPSVPFVVASPWWLSPGKWQWVTRRPGDFYYSMSAHHPKDFVSATNTYHMGTLSWDFCAQNLVHICPLDADLRNDRDWNH